jgi:TonB family protein
MATSTMRRSMGVALAVCLLAAVPSTAAAQDALTRAKGLYASAEYEEALQLFESLSGRTPSTEVSAYHVFCLVALGRSTEARAAIQAIVRQDPLFRPSEAQASPRVRGFFEDVRRPLLPEVVRQLYATAKAAYDRKDWQPALSDFDRVIALADEISETEPGLTDLRTLALGFRDLTKAALTPPPPPPAPEPVAPPPTPVTVKTSVPAEKQVYGVDDIDVKRPLVLSQPMPAWRPATPTEEKMRFTGAVELLISEEGKVMTVKLIESVHPRFDASLLEVAKNWTFKPATKDGKPVMFRYAVGVTLGK